MVEQIINSHKSVVFLNGSFPDKNILHLMNLSVPLIAADGVVRKMEKIGLKPTQIVGDMDSYKEQRANVIEILDQDSTDFEKCLSYIKKENLSPSLILGVNGGEIDHILGNAQVMAKHAKNTPMYFLDTYQNFNQTGIKLGIPITSHVNLAAEKGAHLSIIAFQEAVISTKGLKWDLNNESLQINGILGLRNLTASNQIEITVKKGKILIILDITKFLQKNQTQ